VSSCALPSPALLCHVIAGQSGFPQVALSVAKTGGHWFKPSIAHQHNGSSEAIFSLAAGSACRTSDPFSVSGGAQRKRPYRVLEHRGRALIRRLTGRRRPWTYSPMAPARQLPIYQLGFDAGRDVGLMIALNAIVAEMARQDEAAPVAALDPRQHVDTAWHRYCAGWLLVVGQIVAGRFRQVTHD
jgi:hypothetical protein